MILLGGDYVFLNADRIDAIASRLAKLRAPLGIYAVTFEGVDYGHKAIIYLRVTP